MDFLTLQDEGFASVRFFERYFAPLHRAQDPTLMGVALFQADDLLAYLSSLRGKP